MKHRLVSIVLPLAALAALTTGCSKKEQTETRLADSTGASAPSGASGAQGSAPKDDWSWANQPASPPPSGSAVTEPEPGASGSIQMPPEPEPPAPKPPAPKPKPQPARPAPAAPEAAPAPVAPAAPPPPEPVKVTYSAPAGSSVTFSLDQALSSATSQVGEPFTAQLTADLTDGRGHVVLPAGTRLRGTITRAVPAKKAEKKSFLAYSLVEAQLPDGTLVPISASKTLEGKGWSKKEGAIIGGSAGGGALAGGIIGGDAKGAAIGAVVGAAIGSGVALSQKGEDVTVPSGEVITLPLDSAVSIERLETATPVTTSG